MSNNYADLSQLEREFELEMDGAPEGDLEVDFESLPEDSEFELEADDKLQDESSFELNDVEQEFEGEFRGGRSDEFVERFLEISGRQFESPYEADAAMGEVLDDIEREYFFGAIKRGLKKLSKNKLLKSLAKKGLSLEKARRLLWMLTSRDVYRMLVHEGGWTPDEYETWLGGAIVRELIAETAQ